jgi:hypothetical protein
MVGKPELIHLAEESGFSDEWLFAVEAEVAQNGI